MCVAGGGGGGGSIINFDSLHTADYDDGIRTAMDWHCIHGGVVILLATSNWISCDGLVFHPWGNSNTYSHFILDIL